MNCQNTFSKMLKGYKKMNIKKKLIALTAVLAIFTSFAGAGCSDKKESDDKGEQGNSSSVADNAADETLSQEEYDAVAKHDLSIEPFVPNDGEVAQDAVEGNEAEGDAAGNADSNSSTAAGENVYAVADNDPGSNNIDLPAETGLEIHNGTRTTMQAWWMDISKQQDYVFNGEYLVAEFKIKDGTGDGIYPITIDHADFANWDSKTVKFETVDGAVIVGGEATENKFNESGAPQLMVSNVAGKAGETVKITIQVKDNPGVVANVLRFSYNSDVLEFVSAGEGADFNGKFSS